MKQNEMTAFKMVQMSMGVFAENLEQIQQVINDATMLAHKITKLRCKFSSDEEDRRVQAAIKATGAIENAIDILGTMYGYELSGKAKNVLDLGDIIDDDEAAKLLADYDKTAKAHKV